jgi:hypothetical protein
MELNIITLSEISQAQKHKYHMFSLRWGIKTENNQHECISETVWGREAAEEKERKERVMECEYIKTMCENEAH